MAGGKRTTEMAEILELFKTTGQHIQDTNLHVQALVRENRQQNTSPTTSTSNLGTTVLGRGESEVSLKLPTLYPKRFLTWQEDMKGYLRLKNLLIYTQQYDLTTQEIPSEEIPNAAKTFSVLKESLPDKHRRRLTKPFRPWMSKGLWEAIAKRYNKKTIAHALEADSQW